MQEDYKEPSSNKDNNNIEALDDFDSVQTKYTETLNEILGLIDIFHSNNVFEPKILYQIDILTKFISVQTKNMQEKLIPQIEYFQLGKIFDLTVYFDSCIEENPNYASAIDQIHCIVRLFDVLTSNEGFSFYKLGSSCQIGILAKILPKIQPDHDCFSKIVKFIKNSLFSDASEFILQNAFQKEFLFDLFMRFISFPDEKLSNSLIMILYYFSTHNDGDSFVLLRKTLEIDVREQIQDPIGLCFLFWSIFYFIESNLFDFEALDDLFAFLEFNLHKIDFNTKIVLPERQQKYLIPLMKVYQSLFQHEISIPIFDLSLFLEVLHLASSELFEETCNLLSISVVRRHPEKQIEFLNVLFIRFCDSETNKRLNIAIVIADIIELISDDFVSEIFSFELFEFISSVIDKSGSMMKKLVITLYRMFNTQLSIGKSAEFQEVLHENSISDDLEEIIENTDDPEIISMIEQIIGE